MNQESICQKPVVFDGKEINWQKHYMQYSVALKNVLFPKAVSMNP